MKGHGGILASAGTTAIAKAAMHRPPARVKIQLSAGVRLQISGLAKK
jgi:hypothetical protein